MNVEPVYERWERKVKAEAMLAMLEGRGLAITAAQRKQVLACTDDAQLDAWLRAAGTTPSVKALLASGASRKPREKRSRAVAEPR